jgi:hypothetical protein
MRLKMGRRMAASLHKLSDKSKCMGFIGNAGCSGESQSAKTAISGEFSGAADKT